MKKTFGLYVLLLGLYFICSLSSCLSSKQQAYFNNIKRDSISNIHPDTIETRISKNDVLQVSISTLDPATTAQLNPANITSSIAATGGSALGGYLVDESGMIVLPLIGPVKAEGLTKKQLAKVITDHLLDEKIAKSPLVVVRIVNYKITVLGEVNRPGVVNVPNEKITLPEALGQAGDLTIYGRRNNVLLIREDGDKRIYKRFSLNDSQLFDKDIYNLRNQDIIYVEPNNAKVSTADRTTQLLPVVISVVSLVLVLYVTLIRDK
jgi:polysaccharide biosynthesis/export protein